MKYLQDQPFTVGGASKAYSDGWDAIFGPKKKPEQSAQTCGAKSKYGWVCGEEPGHEARSPHRDLDGPHAWYD